MKSKNPKTVLIGSVVSLVVAVITLISRFVIGGEMNSIKNSGALIVIAGSKQMSRSEYLEYASKLVTSCTFLTVIFLAAAALLFVKYRSMQNKDEH